MTYTRRTELCLDMVYCTLAVTHGNTSIPVILFRTMRNETWNLKLHPLPFMKNLQAHNGDCNSVSKKVYFEKWYYYNKVLTKPDGKWLLHRELRGRYREKYRDLAELNTT